MERTHSRSRWSNAASPHRFAGTDREKVGTSSLDDLMFNRLRAGSPSRGPRHVGIENDGLDGVRWLVGWLGLAVLSAGCIAVLLP